MLQFRTVAFTRMISVHFILFYLWIAPHLLLALVAGFMFRSGRYREFPVFFGYLLFEILQFCVLFSLGRLVNVSVPTYQQIDLFGRAGSIAFRFAIIQELLEASVAHSPSLRKTAARVLKGVTLLLVLLASVFIGSVYSWNPHRMVFPAFAVNHALNIVQCGLLAFVFLWYRFLRLKMQGLVVGIALGMGLIAGLDPLLIALKDFRTMDALLVNLLQMGAYHISVLIWLYYATVKEEVTSYADVASVQHARESLVELGRLI
jgi:hypothetical protein